MKRLLIISIFLLGLQSTFAQTSNGYDVETQKIKVFPNPASKVVTILGLTNSQQADITISDISGNEVMQLQWAIRNNAVSIPIPNLNTGIYVVRIRSKEQQVQTKFYKN